MSAHNSGYRSVLPDSFEGLDSPFLDQELFSGQGEEEWQPWFGALEAESPFLRTFDQGRPTLMRLAELEEEFIEEEERTDADDLAVEGAYEDALEDLDEAKLWHEPDEPEFDYDLRAATRDFSLKTIADRDNLPDEIRTDILRDGKTDVNDLASRALWSRHADIAGQQLDKTGTKHAKLRAEWSAYAHQAKALIWLRQVIDVLDKTRGDIPRDFLLGWMAVESDGKVSTVSRLKERGYFQVMWQGGEAKQIGLTWAQFLRLSTDREFSIEQGIRLAESYRQHFLKRYPAIPDGSDLLWRLTKGRHAYPSALDKEIDALVKVGNPITWQAVSQRLPKLADGVDRSMAYASKLKPLADRVGAPSGTMQPEYESLAGYDDDEVRIFDETSLEADDRSAARVLDVAGESHDDLRVSEAFELDTIEQVMASGPAQTTLETDPEMGDAEFGYEEQFEHEEPWGYDSPQQEQESEAGLGRKLKYLALLPHFVEVKGKDVPLTPVVMDPGIYDGPVKYKVAAQLQQCLMGVMGRKEFSHIKVGLVDLTKDVAAPEFAGYHHKAQVFIASVAKIAPFYVAFQLRHDLQTALDQKKSKTLTELFDSVRDDWAATQIDSKGKATPWSLGVEIRGKLVLWHGSPLGLFGPKTPRLSNILMSVPAGKPVKVEFKRTGETRTQLQALVVQYHAAGSEVDKAKRRLDWAKEKGDASHKAAATKALAQAKSAFAMARTKVDALGFEERLRIMIGGDVPISNYMTQSVVGDLGFLYITSALLQSGLYDTNRNGGLWLGARYGGSGWRGALGGGGPQSATTGSLAALMTLMIQDRLVSPAASAEMRDGMQKAPHLNAPGTGSWFEQSLSNLNGGGSIQTLLAKVGLAGRGADECAFIQRGTVDAQGKPKVIRYVVVCLRANNGSELERLVLELDKCILVNNALTPTQGGHP